MVCFYTRGIIVLCHHSLRLGLRAFRMHSHHFRIDESLLLSNYWLLRLQNILITGQTLLLETYL